MLHVITFLFGTAVMYTSTLHLIFSLIVGFLFMLAVAIVA